MKAYSFQEVFWKIHRVVVFSLSNRFLRRFRALLFNQFFPKPIHMSVTSFFFLEILHTLGDPALDVI